MVTSEQLPAGRRLVAIDVPGGPHFVDTLRRVWGDGDAVFVPDRRLPGPLFDSVLAAMAPSEIIDSSGERHRLPEGRPVEPGDAVVVATSGTSGTPRGVVLTHDAVASSASATSARLGVTAGDHWLACLPLSHVGGLSVVTRALLTGTELTVIERFDVEAVMRSRANLVALVATALARVDATRFRAIVLGGATPPVLVPANVVTTYGMTETGSGIVYDGVPLDGVDVRIAEDGEIAVRGPMLLRCYRDGIHPLVDGWLATGDLGAWSDDGHLVVHGRRGDLIVTGGENVWPEPVEASLRRHPDVADVGVAGVPDDKWGTAVAAFVVPRRHAPSLVSLRDHVKEQLPAFSAPQRLYVVDELPRTALGKLRRDLLVAGVAGDLDGQVATDGDATPAPPSMT